MDLLPQLLSSGDYRIQGELLDLTHDAIFVRSFQNRILYWNGGAERMYGWQKEEAYGRITHELLRTRFPKPLAEIEADILEKGSWEGEVVRRRRDGASLIVSSRWALRRDAAGNPASIMESNTDITQRKREEEKFRKLLESAPDAIVIVNDCGRIVLTNAQTEKIFGYPQPELLGQPVEMLVPERYRGSHSGHRTGFFAETRSRETGAVLEICGQRKDRTEFPAEISLGRLEGEEGTLILSAIRDVTLRRHAEEQIRNLNLDLNRKVTELRALNHELESFSHSVSHDLRSPLRHIDGFARILKEEHAQELSEPALRYLDRVLDGATHMGHLIDDLLNFAQLGRRELCLESAGLGQLLREVIVTLEPLTEGRAIEWRIGSLPDVMCDPGLIKIVLTNLLSNALKFTRGCTTAVIQIGTKEVRDETVVFIGDNGVGFDPRYADKLFGVFQRLHRPEDFEGTGIGLATVQRILDRHGSRIWAEGNLDKGATFYFTLPGAQELVASRVPLGISSEKRRAE